MKFIKSLLYTLSLTLLFFSTTSSAYADDCSDGLIWNENIKQCLNAADDARINEKQLVCDSKAAGSAKDSCNEMVQSFDKDPEDYVSTTDVGTSSKEKTLKSVDTAKSVIGGVFAAYKVAKMGTSAFSDMCISGMMSIATGIMSFINDKNLDKQVKNTLKASQKKLDALIAENERSKGTSYEMQIKLMQAYKELLEAGSQAAQVRENGYKQEITMYSISLGIAAIEMIIYAIPPNVQADKISCAAWVAGSATVSLVLGSQMKKSASEAIKKYDSEAEKLGNIIKKYMDFFNKKHIDQANLAFQTAVPTTSAPINAKDTGEANTFSNTSLTSAEKNMCEAAPETSCCNDSGKKCPTFNVSFQNPAISTAVGESGLSGALDRAQSSLTGSLDLSDGDVSLAIDKDLQRAGAFRQRVLSQLKDQGKLSNTQAEMFDESKQMKAFLKKQFGNENANLSASFGDNMALPEVDRITKIIGEEESTKEKSKDKSNTASSNGAYDALQNLKNSLQSLSLEDEGPGADTGLDSSDLVSANGLSEDEEYVYDKAQIVEKPEVSIFQVISNRYNVLRINKRFGQRAAK